MTKDEILAMVPGRELDALVAEKVLGYWWSDGPKHDYDGPCEWERILIPPNFTEKDLKSWVFPPKGKIAKTYFITDKYSTDIAAAWKVVEKLKSGKPIYMRIFWQDNYGAAFGNPSTSVFANTAPEAICKAALLTTLEDTV
jgi:hypothetical protein